MLVLSEVYLHPMTRELCHAFFKKFENDTDIFVDSTAYAQYQYDEKKVNEYFDMNQDASRIVFAVMLDNKPIGEIKLKNIDFKKEECSLGIHLVNDSVKGKGYGTQAEKLALQYAFEILRMQAVNADTLVKNVRSQRVLEKVGFQYVQEEDGYRYYKIKKRKR